MRWTTALLAVTVLAALAAPTTAAIDEGDWEIQIAGNLMLADFQQTVGAELALGYFVTPWIEVGGRIGYSQTDFDGRIHFDGGGYDDIDLTCTEVDAAAFVTYYFDVTSPEWMPYVGGFFGYRSGKLEDHGDDIERDGLVLGGYVGIKYFVADRATIFFEYRLTWLDQDWEGSSATVRTNDFDQRFLIGVSLLF